MTGKFKFIFLLVAGVLFLMSFAVPKPLTCPVATYNNWNETTSEKTIGRELKRVERRHNPHDYHSTAEILFSAAYLKYLRTGVIDTLGFFNAIENFKKDYSKSKKSWHKAEALYTISLCYYYMGDYKTAKMWTAKSVKARAPSCAQLTYAKCIIKLDDPASADSVIKNYSETNGFRYDSIKEVVLTDIKNGH